MDILLISDTHANPEALKTLAAFLEKRSFKFDLALTLGDITVPGQENYLDKLKALFAPEKIPFWGVAGNFDSPLARQKMEELDISLHHRIKSLDSAPSTPFTPSKVEGLAQDKSFDSSPLARDKEKSGFQFTGINFGEMPSLKINLKDKILVTHEPPRLASLALGKLTFKNAPAIHIAGHLHKPAFVKRLGQTLWIQVPTLQDGRLAVLHLPEKKVEFIPVGGQTLTTHQSWMTEGQNGKAIQ